jgi:CheY-like chemotaxis protein
VLDRLKTNTALSSIPVIILTADESPESELKGLEAGAAAFLHKPVQEDAIIAAVERAVGSMSESPIADTRLQR